MTIVLACLLSLCHHDGCWGQTDSWQGIEFGVHKRVWVPWTVGWEESPLESIGGLPGTVLWMAQLWEQSGYR